MCFNSNDLVVQEQPSWIWPSDQGDEVNQYVEFYHEFDLTELASDSKIMICVDGNYTAWLNGSLVGVGGFKCFPEKKYYDVISIGDYIKTGRNVLAVRVAWFGESNFSYVKEIPGLMYLVSCGQNCFKSGKDTLYRKSMCYKQGKIPLITRQVGFTFEYNAEFEDDWLNCHYVPVAKWTKITADELRSYDSHGQLCARPVENLEIGKAVNSSVVAQGFFKREADSDKNIAQLMQSDFLSSRTAMEVFANVLEDSSPVPMARELDIKFNDCDGDGAYLVVDMGREECGYFTLEINAPKGTLVDFAYGQHLDDLRVRASVGGRNFASRYFCKEGFQTFTHYITKLSGRFLQLHISECSGELKLFYAGFKPVSYPVSLKGEFDSPNPLQNKIYDVSLRTLHLCMHEHYVDTPWREQALFAGDALNQALCGYYCFGEYVFPKASLELLGDGLKNDGCLEMCAPAEIELTIPSFTFVWILALSDYLLFSGDYEYLGKVFPKIAKILESFIEKLDGSLLPSPKGKRYWHFYDWAHGLDGVEMCEGEYVGFYALNETRFDAPLNMFFAMALKKASKLAMYCGKERYSETLRIHYENIKLSFNKRFWDADRELFKTYIGADTEPHFCELTQSLALCSQICPTEMEQDLRSAIVGGKKDVVKATLSQSLYKYEALLQDKQQYANWCFDDIQKRWSEMLYAGATSFWETSRGGWDFDNAGSLCHGWSSLPIYFYYAYLLGIKPTEPGFKKFTFEPCCNVVSHAKGNVPTPYGSIGVHWQKEGSKMICNVSHPKEIIPEVVNGYSDLNIEMNFAVKI